MPTPIGTAPPSRPVRAYSFRSTVRPKAALVRAEPFDAEGIVTGLRAAVAEIDPDAEFRYEVVDRYAPSGGIARVLRRVARDTDTDIAFVGSENAGGS